MRLNLRDIIHQPGASVPFSFRLELSGLDFFGSRPFSRTNEYLKEHGIEPIDWQIENI